MYSPIKKILSKFDRNVNDLVSLIVMFILKYVLVSVTYFQLTNNHEYSFTS